MDSLSAALGAISVTTEMVVEELEPHIETLLTAVGEKKSSIAEQVVESGILPVLAQALRRKSALTVHSARLVAELSREACFRDSCFETGIVSALLTLLLSENQELLLHASRAIGRICCDSYLQQDRLLRLGAVPRLLSVLLQYCENEALLSSCLLAVCNLAGMNEEDGSTLVWEKRSNFDEEVHVFHGTSQHSFGFVSAVTVVRLNQWSHGQHSVSVEVVQKCSTLLWKEHNRYRTERHSLSFTCLGFLLRFYKVIKCSVRNLTKNRSHLRSAVFHTFL
ncbi:uncharacterized protein si:dkey-21e13.3 [Tachysurus ichikawai]